MNTWELYTRTDLINSDLLPGHNIGVMVVEGLLGRVNIPQALKTLALDVVSFSSLDPEIRERVIRDGDLHRVLSDSSLILLEMDHVTAETALARVRLVGNAVSAALVMGRSVAVNNIKEWLDQKQKPSRTVG